ncbi:MAG: hypothetical protein A2V86_06495 [Deltaproteobacteria bacterium RBG_16_49_23]|nr:MAG: hypothetical protein A2V86_06495 [Deltaproteobacteria bacterium RBG_16_49_23]
MPIPNLVIERTSRENEAVAEKCLKKMGFRVKRLDRQGPRRRPEFLVLDSSGPILLCEVKTIFSGGYLHDRNVHVSTEDSALLDTGTFQNEINFSRIDECLCNAIGKCRTLGEDVPALVNLPLLVVFFFDFFADYFDFYPCRMERFPEVSGVATIEVDHEIRKRAKSMSLQDLKATIESGSMKGWPPNSKGFVVVPNECAASPLPSHFLHRCLTRP